MFKDGAYYNGIGPALKEHFGMRMVKASIDGGFTCPNRDGTCGYGGCIFCSEQGSGDFTGNFSERKSDDNISKAIIKTEEGISSTFCLRKTDPVTKQIDAQLEVMNRKWKDAGCLAYFQSYTNTYAPVSVLREKFEEALTHPVCKGLCIATRPDCVDDEVIEYLSELNQRTFIWVELGLQTADDETAAYINRGCSLSDYDEAVDKLLAKGIRVVTHLIFGLPGETREDMLKSVAHVCSKKIYGIKIQLLHIMKGTLLGDMYLGQTGDRRIIPMTKEQYISYVADALEIIPADITVHRLTGDAPKELLIEPQWSRDKKSVLNGINMELKRRGTWQGARSEL